MSAGWRTFRGECPICGHKGWCGESEDHRVVHCMRVESPRACAGGGWLHFLRENPPTERGMHDAYRQRANETPPMPRINAPGIWRKMRDRFEDAIFDNAIRLGEELGLTGADCDRLLPGICQEQNAWAFPMRDGDGNVTGIRLRRMGGKEKWSVRGSRDGLFYDPDLACAETMERGLKGRELVIVEGASDAAAGYALGLPAVGRSSCATGGDALRRLCDRLKATRVTIVADNDGAKARGNGFFRPGADGARALAAKIGRLARIVTPPTKDLRDWHKRGLTRETFWKVAKLQRWTAPQADGNRPQAGDFHDAGATGGGMPRERGIFMTQGGTGTGQFHDAGGQRNGGTTGQDEGRRAR